jgi:Uma2 family endonuclease
MTVADHPSRPARDTYRFGRGPEIALQPGTMGWTAADLDDPEVRALWDAGPYEILDGVLTIMPPAYFRGGNVLDNLKFVLRNHFAQAGIRAQIAGEVDLVTTPSRVVRADGVVVLGEQLRGLEALRFDTPDTDWRDHALTLPPTLVIESVSRGHEFHDHVTKRQWYAEFGVPHYWIIDGKRKSLECFGLETGAYVVDAQGRDEAAVSPAAFPGLIIPLGELWKD